MMLLDTRKPRGVRRPAVLRPGGKSRALILHEQILHGPEPLAVGRLEIPAVDALRRAERQHDVLVIASQRGVRLGLRQDQATAYVAVQVPDVGVAHTAEVGVGAGAEAGVFLHVPVFQVVAGGKARLGKVGYLVLFIAVLCQNLTA